MQKCSVRNSKCALIHMLIPLLFLSNKSHIIYILPLLHYTLTQLSNCNREKKAWLQLQYSMKNLVHNNNLYVISRTNINLPITVYVMSYNPCWKCCINQHEFHFGQLVYAESILTVSSQAILNLCWGPACKTYAFLLTNNPGFFFMGCNVLTVF